MTWLELTFVISDPGGEPMLNTLAFADKPTKQKTKNTETPKCTPIFGIYLVTSDYFFFFFLVIH